MQFGMRSIGREVGTALAVLAIYLLVLLAPWHQANALQHDLAELGYATAQTVDICTPSGLHDGDGNQSPAIKCPATGIGKFELALVEPPTILLPAPAIAELAIYPAKRTGGHPALAAHVGQARAPPVTV
jgi:hypothetical protein